MSIYLGLGCNQGDRRHNLNAAIERLIAAGFALHRVSPIVESPAMLPNYAESSWNKPFLNIVVSGDASWRPEQGLAIAKKIESELGRQIEPRWSPRPIDIDLLVWKHQQIQTKRLTIPHPGIVDRDFVITPLLHLKPGLEIIDSEHCSRSVFELSLGRKNIPLWMAILNITPDSFSDGDSGFDGAQLEQYLDKLIGQNIQILDIGAESTRPGADSITHKDEWRRLEPVLEMVNDKLAGRHIKPLISLDSRNPRTIEKAIVAGIDIINDVTALDDPAMAAIASDSDCQVVAMHAMTVPVDPTVLLPNQRSAVPQIVEWIERKMAQWTDLGIDLDRMIIDPGIGFGKSSIQACELMSHCKTLRSAGMRLLIGHSRKSFMTGFTNHPACQRDLETLGMSLALCQQGVDIIRVHQPFIHQRAYRAWSHILI